MTDNDFDKLVKQKLENFELEVPSTCWDAIEKSLPQPAKPKLTPLLWPRLAVAAIVVFAISLSAYLFLQKEIPMPNIAQVKTASKTITAITSKVVEKQTQSEEIKQNIKTHILTQKSAPNRLYPSSDVKFENTVKSDLSTFIPDTKAVSESVAEVAKSVEVKSEETKIQPKATQEEIVSFVNAGLAAQEAERTFEIQNKTKSSSLAMLASMPVETHSSTDNEFRSLRATSNTDEVLNMLNANQANAGATNSTRHHSMPFSLGLLVNKEIYRNLMIQTGLHFTYLRSTQDVTGTLTGYENYSSNEIQKLYYLGIPLTLNYYIVNLKRLNVYVTAGGMVEKNIAGNWTDEIRGDNKVIYQTSTNSDNHLEEQLQWSVHTGIGIDMRISRWLHFYVEPAYTYFPDNGSKIDNIRKKEKYEISLQGGLKAIFRSK